MNRFKKALSLILTFLLVIGCFSACGNTDKTDSTENKNIYQKSNPADDSELNILMIGSSSCYYYTDELYGMLKATGIEARVANIYYSGCPLEKHWLWWKEDQRNYDFFVLDSSGRTEQNAVGLNDCLEQYNWDYITLQESGSNVRKQALEEVLTQTATYRSELTNYLKEQFPQSRFGWHQTWAYQIGYNRSGYKVDSLDVQQKHYEKMKAFSEAVAKENVLELIPSGTAWQIARANPVIGDTLNNKMANTDYYHDGDVGGGQYLNACVWFERITGQSCIGNTFRPSYQLPEEKIAVLQQSAHEAVQGLK